MGFRDLKKKGCVSILAILVCFRAGADFSNRAAAPNQNAARYAHEVYLGTPDYHKAVKVWEANSQAASDARILGLSGDSKVRFITDRTQEAEVKYFGAKLGGTLTDAVVGDMAGAVGVERTYDYFVKQADEKGGMMPEYASAANGVSGPDLIQAALDKNHPKHEFAKSLLKRSVAYNEKMPLTSQEKIKDSIENDHVKAMLDGNHELLLRLLNKGRLSKQELAQLQTATEKGVLNALEAEQKRLALLQEVARARQKDLTEKGRNSIFWNTMSNEEKAAFYSEKIGQGNKAIRSFSGMAKLFGETEIEQKLEQQIAIWKGVDGIIDVTLTKSFGSNPFDYISAYTAGASALLSFFASSSQRESEFQAIYSLLQSIATQIRDLHRDMRFRFDLLDQQAKAHFQMTASALDDVVTTGRLNSEKLEAIQYELKSIKNMLNTGFRLPWAIKESDMGKCFGKKLSADLLDNCRSYYTMLANHQVPANDTDKENNVASLSDSERLSFYSEIKKIDPFTLIPKVHPATWNYAGEALLELFKSNQPSKKDIQAAHRLQPAWSLSGVIQAGTEMIRSQESLLLTNDGKSYHLKFDTLKSLLQKYEDEITEWYDEGRAISDMYRRNGPNPKVGPKKEIIVSHQHAFYNKPIQFCENLHFKQIELRSGADKRIRGLFAKYNPNWVVTGPEFLHMLPPEVQWASKMGERRELKSESDFANVTITPCFKAVTIHEFKYDQGPRVTYRIEMMLSFYLSYQKYGEEEPTTVEIAYATLDEKGKTGDIEFNLDGSDCTFFPRYWNHSALCGSGKLWEPLGQNLNRFTVYFADNKITREFYSYFDEFQKSLAMKADKQFEKFKTDDSHRSLDAQRMLYLATYLGLEQNNESARALLKWLSTEGGLPSRRTITQLGFQGQTTRKQVKEMVKKRLDTARYLINRLNEANDLRPRQSQSKKILEGLKKVSGLDYK